MVLLAIRNAEKVECQKSVIVNVSLLLCEVDGGGEGVFGKAMSTQRGISTNDEKKAGTKKNVTRCGISKTLTTAAARSITTSRTTRHPPLLRVQKPADGTFGKGVGADKGLFSPPRTPQQGKVYAAPSTASTANLHIIPIIYSYITLKEYRQPIIFLHA